MFKERKKGEIIKKINMILREIIDDPQVIITILDVNLVYKKGNMFIYLSIFPDKKKFEVIKNLKKDILKIKSIIKKRKILKYLPKKIFFRYDPGLKFMQEIDKILK